MQKCQQLTLVQSSDLLAPHLPVLQELSQKPLLELDQLAFVDQETDALLIGLKIEITREFLQQHPKLKYIGIRGTSLAKVDLQAAQEFQVEVRNVADYCDQDTAHFVILELASMVRGLKEPHWKKEPVSLEGRTLGLIGLGAVGSHVARLGQAFGMNVVYTSRTPKKNQPYEYVSKKELLQRSDFISLHGPAHVEVLSEAEFELLDHSKILINTGLGDVLSLAGLKSWLKDSRNLALFDSIALKSSSLDPQNFPSNLIIRKEEAYKTQQVSERLALRVIENIQSFLQA